MTLFQSQTRRLLPRNEEEVVLTLPPVIVSFNRRRDACFPATKSGSGCCATGRRCFNRRRDACFPATCMALDSPLPWSHVSIADATLASPQPESKEEPSPPQTLFQSQPRRLLPRNAELLVEELDCLTGFNRRRDACFPATGDIIAGLHGRKCVSIADATLASPQRWPST